MKSSEGRHYRQFLQEGVMQFGRHVSSILVTFWCPRVPLATFGGTLGPRPDVFMILCPLLVAAGGVRGYPGNTMWTPLGASVPPAIAFLSSFWGPRRGTSVFITFGLEKGSKREYFPERPMCLKHSK